MMWRLAWRDWRAVWKAGVALLLHTIRSPASAAGSREHAVVSARRILGEQSFVAVDVGAALGLLPHWEALDRIAEIYQVEPRQDACRELAKANARRAEPGRYHVMDAALSEHGGTCALYVSNAPTGTSLFHIDPALSRDCADYVDLTYLYPITEVQLETTTLAQLLGSVDQPQADLIKLDVQGLELPILRGMGDERLDGLLGVEVEIGLHDLYPQDVGFEAMTSLLKKYGFELFDLRTSRVHRPLDGDHAGYQKKIFEVYAHSPTISARIWELDAVYFKRKSILLERKDPLEIRRMALVYSVYNFFSEAYALVEMAQGEGIFPDAEAAALKREIVTLHRQQHYRAWLADSAILEWFRRKMYRIAPRSVPRWCQYMYQDYPNG